MRYNIVLHPDAADELKNSYQWYEERSEGLGTRFVASVNKRLYEIADHPERYPKKKANYREVRTDIFPILLFMKY